MERILDWHIVDEALVKVIEQLLSLESVLFFHPPEVFCLVEVAVVALDLHFARGDVWDGSEAMLREDGLYVCIVRVVDHAKERWHGQMLLMLTIGVCSTNELLVDQVALVAASLDCEDVDQVVWTWILNHKLSETNK